MSINFLVFRDLNNKEVFINIRQIRYVSSTGTANETRIIFGKEDGIIVKSTPEEVLAKITATE